MNRYLLDTNIVSALINEPVGELARYARRYAPEALVTSIIVAAELRFGAVKRNSARLLHDVETILQSFEILPFDTPADHAYARLRTDLECAGTPISSNDMLIAAHALAYGCTLVTANEREFRRVPGLAVENWLS